MNTPHIQCLRLGKEYRSFNESEVKDYRNGAVKATMSQVNAGVIRRDLLKIDQAREALQKFTTRELIDINAKEGYLPSIRSRGKAANSDHYFFSEAGVPSFFMYLMGDYEFYHIPQDNANNLKLGYYYSKSFSLIKDFIIRLN